MTISEPDGNAHRAANSQHVVAMGLELGSLFYTLWQHTANAFTLWGEFEALFADSKERINFLNEAALGHFFIVQDVLFESVLLQITRLTCPTETGRGARAQSNITIRSLPALVMPPHPLADIEAAVIDAVKATAFAMPARHKWIAHLDARTMLDPSADTFTLGSRAEMNNALDKIATALNAVQIEYEGSPTIFRTGGPLGGADQLLYVLANGLKYEKERHRALLRAAGLEDPDSSPG